MIEEEFGHFEDGKGLGKGKAVAKEEMDGEVFGAGVGLNDLEWVSGGSVDDQSMDGWIGGCELGCKTCSQARAVEDDVVFGDGARLGEEQPGGGGIFGHADLIGMEGGAFAVAAIVDGEEVESGFVEKGQGGDGVGEGAVPGGKEEDGGQGIAGSGRRGDVPGGALREAASVGTEVEEHDGCARECRRMACGSGGVEDELPLALVEEEAESGIAADQGGNDGDTDGFEEPDGIDDLRRTGGRSRGILPEGCVGHAGGTFGGRRGHP